MPPKSKQKTFRVAKLVRLWVEVPVVAGSVEEAVELAKSMAHDSFVTPVEDAEVLDSNTVFYGVTVADVLDKLDI